MNIKTVYTELTNRCNLNCATCYNRSGANRRTVELRLADVEKIISTFSRYGAVRFLFSGGEPTLYSELDALLELLSRYPEYEVGFVTNGTSRSQRFIDFINTRENVTLQISLDGSSEEQNAKTRGVGHFHKAIEFAKMIRPVSKKPLLKMVISQNNLADVADFYKLALSVGCLPEFAFIYRSGNANNDWEAKAVSAQEKIKIVKLIDTLNKEYGVEARLPLCTVRCPYSANAEDLFIGIKPNGDVQPCQTLYDPKYTLCNILDFNEDAFLARMQETVDLAKRRTSVSFGCEKCMLSSACGRGCMSEAVNLNGDPLGDDGNCLFRKLQFIHCDMKFYG